MKNEFLKLEKELLSEKVRTSEERLSDLLTDDFLEYGSSGRIYNKRFILDTLPSSPYSEIEIIEFEIYQISTVCIQTRFQTLEWNGVNCNRSSLWRKVGGTWKMFFHQGTQNNS